MSRSRRALALLACCVLIRNPAPVAATVTTQTPATLLVDAPRPLAETVQRLRDTFGWTVTYEDPPYEHASELEDVTASNPGAKVSRVLNPRRGRFAFALKAGTDSGVFDAGHVLGEVLAAYNRSGNPGTFTLEEEGGAYHVVPTRRTQANGEVVAHTSLLGTPISLAHRDRTLGDAVQAILRALSKANGRQVEMATVPLNTCARCRTDVGSGGETARTVLMQAFTDCGQRLAWSLYYSPTFHRYYFNVSIVKPRE